MRERILELARAEMPDDEIAATLTREGHRSPTGDVNLTACARAGR